MLRQARKPRGAALALASTLAALIGCSLVVDTSDIDENCRTDQKICDGRCVSRTDPAFGCKFGICSPCELVNTIPTCNEQTEKCESTACVAGFGCEECRTNLLTDEANCGECRLRCPEGDLCADGECLTPR